MTNKNRSRTQRVNTALANAWLDGAGLSIERFAARIDLSEKTIRRLLHGEPAYLNTIRTFAEYFGREPSELLDVNGQAPSRTHSIGGWQIDSPLGPVAEAANGLQYRLFELRSPTGDRARGKRYVLDHLSSRERRRVQEHLLRHTNVCNQVGHHRNLTEHIEIKSCAGEDLWWVIDEWIEGVPLNAFRSGGPVTWRQWLPLMAEVAEGLSHLHANNVIMRQLSPAGIVVSTLSHTPIIVDFEMAKLLDQRPTVAPTESWPEDAYRAPEIGSPYPPTPAADVYSWARIFVYVLTGLRPPPAGDDIAALGGCDLPTQLRNLLAKCLQLNPTRRPRTMQIVRDGLTRFLSQRG